MSVGRELKRLRVAELANTHTFNRRVIMRNAIHSVMLVAVGLLQIAIFSAVFLGV
jgi:hypothetical protein